MQRLVLATIITVLMCVFISCDKDDSPSPDKEGPAIITNLKCESGDGKIKFSWTEPNDIDYEKIKIEITPLANLQDVQSIEVLKGTIAGEISGLENYKEYEFTFTAYDKASNASEQVKDTAMPEIIPQVIEGGEIVSGIYSVMLDNNKDGVKEKITQEFYSSDSVKTDSYNYETMPPTPVRLFGTWSRVGDSLQIDYTKMLVQGNLIEQNATDIIADAFMLTDDTVMQYYAPAIKKIEGAENSIIGKYSSTQRTIMSEYNNTITLTLNIKKDGTWVLKSHSERPDLVQPLEEETNGIWTEQEIRDGIHKLVSYRGKKFIKSTSGIFYTKE